MRNDVSFPPEPNSPGDGDPRPAANTPAAKRAAAARANGRGPTHARPYSPTEPSGLTHPHTPDRAHSLEKTRDKPATGMIYETPEDRGGIDSTVLSIIVISVVTIALLFILWTVYRGGSTTPRTDPTVPNATIADDPPAPAGAAPN